MSNKKNLPNIPIYIGDWEKDCNTLSLEAEAAWLRIIFKMFTKGKQSVYKIPTKSLQNLWRCGEDKMNEILDELEFNEICPIDRTNKGWAIFTSRRFKKENNLSKTRSEAVSNRKDRNKNLTKAIQNNNKTFTNVVQNTENENDYVNENDNKDKNEIESFGKSENLLEIEKLKNKIENEFTWRETVCRNMKQVDSDFNEETFKNYLEQFFKQIQNDGEEVKSMKETKKHFSRWLNIQIKAKNEQNNHHQQGATDDFRRKTAERLGAL